MKVWQSSPQAARDHAELIKALGGDDLASRVANRLRARNVCTLDAFLAVPLLVVADIRGIGKLAMERIGEVRRELGVVEEELSPPLPPVSERLSPRGHESLDVMGPQEVAEYLGVEWPDRLKKMRFFDSSFPRPAVVLMCGPIWRAADIAAYKRKIHARERYEEHLMKEREAQ